MGGEKGPQVQPRSCERLLIRLMAKGEIVGEKTTPAASVSAKRTERE